MNSKNYLILIIVECLAIVLVAFSVLYNHFEEDCLRIFIAWAAKLAAVFFSLAFMASSLNYFFKAKWSTALISYRPHLGLTFTVFHTAHLIFLFILQGVFHPVFDLAARTSLLGGGLAYLFMYAMAFTTFPRFRKMLSPGKWHWLHLIGGWWIWLIFFRSYFKNVFNKGEEYVMFALLSLVLILRVTVYFHSRYSKAQIHTD